MNVKYPERKSIHARLCVRARSLLFSIKTTTTITAAAPSTSTKQIVIIINSISRLIKAPLCFGFRHAHLGTIKKAYSIFNSNPATCSNKQQISSEQQRKSLQTREQQQMFGPTLYQKKTQNSYAVSIYDFVRSFIHWFLPIFFWFSVEFFRAWCVVYFNVSLYSLSNEYVSCGQVRA